MIGKVYLIGAGPGDAGLITQKAIECLKSADVVIYDRLVNQELLAYANKSARLIYAGKQPGRHAMVQQDINHLLVDEAMAGHTIARLKGGDPFVFGRGGEEAMALRQNGLPYEVVPGITSAIAVPAYAGIPVTYRGLASSVHIITGHEGAAKGKSDIDWNVLAKLDGTLIFLMGMERLSDICSQLILYGKAEQTPAAVIERGTTARQRTIVGTLADISQRAAQEEIRSPSVIVIGDVVSLRQQLMWYEHLPLCGKVIMVTRADGQREDLARGLERLGAQVEHFPVISIKPPDDYGPLDEAIEFISQYKWLIFTSANGVESFFDRLLYHGMDSRYIAGIKVGAIGSGTYATLKQHGVIADYVPESFSTDDLARGLKKQITSGMRILLPCSDIAGRNIKQTLECAGAVVDMVTAYRTVPNAQQSQRLIDLLGDHYIDAITFTSSSTVHNFVNILGMGNISLLDGVKLASIGPVTSAVLQQYGLKVDVQADVYTMDGLIEALKEDYSDGHTI